MAFGAVSGVGDQTVDDIFMNLTAMDWDTNAQKGAFYNNSVTPDKTATAANFAYAAGTWSGNEVTSSTDIPAGGLTLGTKVHTKSTNTVVYSSANLVSGAAASCTNYGILIYDDIVATPVAKQAWSFQSFNATVTVTAGTETVIPDPSNGWFKLTV
jgi:hypothetical protein